jgi:Zn-dependent peptidase ImmA (M78 family)/predicted secreted protein
MVSPTRLEVARREGSLAAQRELARLDVDLTRRVEIFDIIQSQGIWLMFQPLDGLFGLYRRINDAAGIQISSLHPTSLQRFTGAHEYGHHVLGHAASIDAEEQIEPRSKRLSLQEIAAQAFAATFLMPLQLVNSVLRGLGLPLSPGDITADKVYELSREMGSSYRATVTQLEVLRKITPAVAQRLRRHQLIDVKVNLARGRRPQNARADVWVLDQKDSDRALSVLLDDEIHVWLPEMPSSGYQWILRSQVAHGRLRANEPSLAVLEDALEPVEDDSDLSYGAQHYRHVWLRAVTPGSEVSELALIRPWEEETAKPARSFVVRVRVSPRLTGAFDQGVSEEQKPALFMAA